MGKDPSVQKQEWRKKTMRKTPLKVLLVALALSLTTMFVACDNQGSGTGPGSGNEATSTTISAGDPAYAQTYPEVKVDYPTGTELFSVEESFVKTQVRNAVMSYLNVDGERRAELLAAVETLKTNESVDLLKGIGTLTDLNIQTPGDGGTYNVNITARGGADEYKKLTDYCKSFSGAEILFESSTSLVIKYDWGRLNTCRFVDSMELIQASFSFSIE
jgi:hypothetical protein